jgi:hypothetical protein
VMCSRPCNSVLTKAEEVIVVEFRRAPCCPWMTS